MDEVKLLPCEEMVERVAEAIEDADDAWFETRARDRVGTIWQAMARAAIEATRPTEQGLAPLPSGRQFMDEAALDRWRDTEGKCGHDLSANNNTVWRLVATIDYYRAQGRSQ